MITSDPYGISGAVRVWDSLDAGKKPVKKRHVDQKSIDMCLNCTAEFCNGTCKNHPPKKKVKKQDPCLTCYSAEVCKRNGYICGEKARWKPAKSGRKLSFDEINAKELLQAGMSYREIGEAVGAEKDTIREWVRRRGLRGIYLKNRGGGRNA